MAATIRTLVVVAALGAAACGSPSGPSAGDYAGQWSGTTGQGQSISFSIGSDEAVTTIAVAYSFNGCSGTQSFANLHLPIKPDVVCVPGPCSGSVASYRALTYSSGDRLNGPSTDIQGLFPTSSRAEGRVNFRSFPGCGSAMDVSWSATRR